jgi:hypothetical protein
VIPPKSPYRIYNGLSASAIISSKLNPNPDEVVSAFAGAGGGV